MLTVVPLALAAGGPAASAQQNGGGPGGGGDTRPTASFEFSPATPSVGQTVTFTSTSRPAPDGQITQYEWDFDGEGGFDDFNGSTATWSFATAGQHVVRLRVRQSDGRQALTSVEVPVTAPAPLPPPVGGQPEPVPAMLSPFPLVRIAGDILSWGARVRVLSVRAPRGSRIRVRCRGTSCPRSSVAGTSATRLVRFPRFERRLRAGTRLALLVRRGFTIGKYTRFTIRAGRAPARVDRCLLPGRSRPVSCP